MALAKDLLGAAGMLAGDWTEADAAAALTGEGVWGGPGIWHHGYLFSQALTIGGGTGDVQRNIIAERVLDLPHDVDVEAGKTWSEARRDAAVA